MSNHFHAGLKVVQKAKNGERLQMPSFHSSFRNRKEDERIDGLMRGLESEQIIAEVMLEVIDASASRSIMFNEEEENNNDPEYQEMNKFVPQENANVDHFVPQENENAEQLVPPVDQFETREEPRYDNNQVQNIDTSYMGQSQPTERVQDQAWTLPSHTSCTVFSSTRRNT